MRNSHTIWKIERHEDGMIHSRHRIGSNTKGFLSIIPHQFIVELTQTITLVHPCIKILFRSNFLLLFSNNIRTRLGEY